MRVKAVFHFSKYLVMMALNLLLCVTSCKKEVHTPPTEVPPTSPQTNTQAAPIQTVYPSSRYLPAYPGSFWTYKGSDGSVFTITTSALYVHDSVNTASFTTPKYVHAMVPIYNGRPLWGVEFYYYMHSGNNGLSSETVVKDSAIKIGDIVYSQYKKSTNGVTDYRVILAKDTSLMIGNTKYYPVIVTRDYTNIPGVGITFGGDRYYARDIGFIAIRTYKAIVRNTSPLFYMPPDSVVWSSELTGYFITK